VSLKQSGTPKALAMGGYEGENQADGLSDALRSLWSFALCAHFVFNGWFNDQDFLRSLRCCFAASSRWQNGDRLKSRFASGNLWSLLRSNLINTKGHC